jgi:hypothetical protein
MNTRSNDLIGAIDRFVSRFETCGTLIDRIADRIVPKAIAYAGCGYCGECSLTQCPTSSCTTHSPQYKYVTYTDRSCTFPCSAECITNTCCTV